MGFSADEMLSAAQAAQKNDGVAAGWTVSLSAAQAAQKSKAQA